VVEEPELLEAEPPEPEDRALVEPLAPPNRARKPAAPLELLLELERLMVA